jgi:ornithine cyclodeaminase/alanine dehydrogenase-like protein (mu-crystallin family)
VRWPGEQDAGAMTHILNNDDVEKVLTMDVCLEAVEQAFQDLGREIAVNQLRTHTYVSLESSRRSYRLKTMNGAVPWFLETIHP